MSETRELGLSSTVTRGSSSESTHHVPISCGITQINTFIASSHLDINLPQFEDAQTKSEPLQAHTPTDLTNEGIRIGGSEGSDFRSTGHASY
ncbi:hypothetical protein PM082_007960 [Marasmius tenuissimus]|nr:hypothetical protein PM082_007960 [Marasmius tenuissimus]